MRYDTGDIVILTPDDVNHHGETCALAEILCEVPFEPYNCYEVLILTHVCPEDHFGRERGVTVAYGSEILRVATQEERLLIKVMHS